MFNGVNFSYDFIDFSLGINIFVIQFVYVIYIVTQYLKTKLIN